MKTQCREHLIDTFIKQLKRSCASIQTMMTLYKLKTIVLSVKILTKKDHVGFHVQVAKRSRLIKPPDN